MAVVSDNQNRNGDAAFASMANLGNIGVAHSGHRLLWLDAARTVALLAMIAFHLFRDLELFGVLPAGTTAQGGWAIAARVIAGSFILLSGVSLVLAHERGFRLKPWAKRLAMISAAAAVVTIATYLVFPDRFIYFGILHCIAACSLIGAILLRSPAWALWALVVLVLLTQSLWGSALFGSPWLAWTGLATIVPPSLDFLPLFPWFAAFVAGMATARSLPLSRWDVPISKGARGREFTWPGRHSLAVYLVHQPVLLAVVWAFVALRS